jgi:ABC-2 type transport system ATP-binding protein
VKGQLTEQASLESIRQGDTLENRFIQLAGSDAVAAPKLAWLEASAP